MYTLYHCVKAYKIKEIYPYFFPYIGIDKVSMLFPFLDIRLRFRLNMILIFVYMKEWE